MDHIAFLKEKINESLAVKTKVMNDQTIMQTVSAIADSMTACFRNQGKVLWCGNGGSAADAQHLSAELSGRYYYDRPPLFSEALHVNTSYLTAVANDYSYDVIFSRLVQGFGKNGDVLIGLSTSGNSANVVKAIEEANKLGMITVGFTGESGGKMKDICKYIVRIPSKDTPRIQECHMLLGHSICDIVEQQVFPR